MKGNGIWMLISGVAVGFIIAREWNRADHGGAGSGSAGKADVVAPAGKGETGAVGAVGAAGPIDPAWLTEDALGAVESMKGMAASARFAVLKFINTTPCDCGCPHGSFAKCKKEDPGCPRAPKVLDQAITLAKQGKSLTEISAATKKPADNGGGAAPAAFQKVEVAAWSPMEGPKLAKVTIVEFSDFQ